MNNINLIKTIYDKFYKKQLSQEDIFSFDDNIRYLKKFDYKWLENKDLLEQRLNLLFEPLLTQKQEQIVYLTHINYLRNIFENNLIDINLHNPICFVTTPVAYYLFPEYTIHLYIDKFKLDAENNVEHNKIGGIIEYKDSVKIEPSFINKIVCKNQSFVNSINNIRKDTGFNKFAVSLKQRGVFKIDEDQRNIRPNSKVVNKLNNKKGTIISIEKGEHGNVIVQYEDKTIQLVEQGDFDYQFVIN